MRPTPVTLLILVAAVVAVACGWLLFAKSEHDRFVAVDQVRHSRSEFRIAYTIEHSSGPIAQETWSVRNVDGAASAAYTARQSPANAKAMMERMRLVSRQLWPI